MTEIKQPAELVRLRDVALAAGKYLLREQDRIGSVDHKSTTELVTDIDREAEARIVAALAHAFPDDGLVAEEGSGSRGSSGRTWYVDPLDGTTNYVHGYPFYAVSLGCVAGDETVLAAVYAPYLDELYLAAAGVGAYLERPVVGGGRRLEPLKPVGLRDALLATGFPYVRDATVGRNTEYLRRFLLASCHGVRRGGSAAIDLCHVAAGKLDGFWELNLRRWDVAAGVLLVRETGGMATDFAGQAGALIGDEILAAAPGLHAQMRDILGERNHG